MNEVTKLYENARAELVADVKFPAKDVNYNVGYPPFTAEKQISLIIFLSYKYGKGLLINLRTMDKDIDIYDFELFGECLAKLVNKLWQDLTEEEKQQVKGILEWKMMKWVVPML